MKTFLSLTLAVLACTGLAFAQETHGDADLYVPPPATGAVFNDVPSGSFGDAYIEAMFNAGITHGCGINPAVFCPEDPIRRNEEAVFIMRAIYRAMPFGGVATCPQPEGVNWAICGDTVNHPRIHTDSLIVATYNTRGSDDQIPIRIYNVQEGSFQFQAQTHQTFTWIAIMRELPQAP